MQSGTNVIHAEHVFKLFRSLPSDFQKMSIVRQREIMRDMIYKIEVAEDGIHVLYYTGPKDVQISKDPSGLSWPGF